MRNDDKLTQEIAEIANSGLHQILADKKAELAQINLELDSPEAKEVLDKLAEKRALESDIYRLEKEKEALSRAIDAVLNPRPRRESRSACMV